MQAIQTRYFSPTNRRGARIKAFCAAGSMTISYPHELSGQACHRKAAETLAAAFHWTAAESSHYAAGLLGAQLANGDYVFLFDNERARD